MPKHHRDKDFETRATNFVRWYNGLIRTDAKTIKEYMDTANTEAPSDQDDRCTQLILVGQPMLKGERDKYLPLRLKHIMWFIENSPQNPVLSIFESIYLWDEHEDQLKACWENRLVGLSDPISLYHAACFYEQRDLEKCLGLLTQAFQSHMISASAHKHAKTICWGVERTPTASDSVRAKAKELRRILPSDIEYTVPVKESARATKSLLNELWSTGLTALCQLLPDELQPKGTKKQENPEFKSTGSADYFYKRGLALKLNGFAERAKSSMRRAAEFDDGDIKAKAELFLRTHLPLHDVPLEAERLNIKGYNLKVEEKRVVEAEMIFKHCVDYFPEFEWPYCNLSSIYIQSNQPDKAIKYLEKALAINPDYTFGLRNMSLAYTALGDNKKALEFMKRAFESFPEDTKLKEEAENLERQQAGDI